MNESTGDFSIENQDTSVGKTESTVRVKAKLTDYTDVSADRKTITYRIDPGCNSNDALLLVA